MAPATPEIRAIYWDIGGVPLTNGWDREERACVLRQFAIPRDAYEARHEAANDCRETGELSGDAFLKQIVFFKERAASAGTQIPPLRGYAAPVGMTNCYHFAPVGVTRNYGLRSG